MGKIRRFNDSIKQLFYWLPIIWKNRWWDYGFLLVLMEHQLNYMLKHWCVDTIHVGDEKIKSEILEMRDNIHKVLNVELDVKEYSNLIEGNDYETWSNNYTKVFNSIGENFSKIENWWD